METCKFTAAGPAVTPVPTAFLAKDMLDAPSDYVKVYLYSLYLATGNETLTSQELEARLHMKSSEIEEALRYWERAGRANMTDAGIEIGFGEPEKGSSKAPAAAASAPPWEKSRREPFPYEDFNLRIVGLVGHTLSAASLQKIYDWTDVFGFPQEVVLMLIEHCIAAKGKGVSIQYMDKCAQAWADRGVDTVEKAQAEIDDYNAASGGARQVMRRMGISGRLPGETERDLYDKWTGEWGFTEDAILYAMTGVEFNSSSPFRFLDGILRKYHEQNAHSAREIASVRDARGQTRDGLKEVLRALRLPNSAMDADCEQHYKDWLQDGFTQEVILLACKKASRYNSHRLEQTDEILGLWKSQGLLEPDAVRAKLAEEESAENKVREMFEAAGIERSVEPRDITLYRTYTVDYKMSPDVLMYAATLSQMAEKPYTYICRTLRSWADQNVVTFEQARRAEANHKATRPVAQALSYAQRPIVQNQAEIRGLQGMRELEKRYGSQ